MTNLIERKMWKPSLTSQFLVCPIPYREDTYRGCEFNCLYCFARDFVTFQRRNTKNKNFSYLVGNRPDLFEKWIERTLNKEVDFKKSEEVAFRERIPMKIGTTSDPFPSIEIDEKITYDFLKILEKYDYPVEIQTKNPQILADYAQDFVNPNWIIAVTIVSTDENFTNIIEPRAPKPSQRLKAIKQITDQGKHVIVKIQPSIYPKILDDLPNLVKSIKESGAFAFQMEGLKIRKTMPPHERALFGIIGDAIGYDLIDYYKKNGVVTGSDWEMTKDKKLEYLTLGANLAKEYGIKFFVADNNMGAIGDGDECCGTEVLRNYNKWGNNSRTKAFGECKNCSTLLGNCFVNFVRSDALKTFTMNEVADKKLNTAKK